MRRPARAAEPAPGGMGVLPNAADRLAPARRLLGGPPTLWVQPTAIPARRLEPPASAHVYLDVSGSMTKVLPYLLGLLVPYARGGAARVFQFSTVVSPLPAAALRGGALTTTYGTDIDPVLAHLVGEPGVLRTLILTDGYVGSADPRLLARLAERGVRLHAVLPSESSAPDALRPLAASVTVLPPLDRGGSGRPS